MEYSWKVILNILDENFGDDFDFRVQHRILFNYGTPICCIAIGTLEPM